MNDLFGTDKSLQEQTLRDELTSKWKEKFPEAPQELIEAKVNSDLYIKTMERQKDEMRNDLIAKDKELQARASMQELIDKINKQQVQPQNTPQTTETQKSEEIRLQDIEKLFESKFEQKKIADIETRNFTEVQNKLRERYGDNASTILQNQANTLGLSKEDVNSLAKKSPEAFFRMLGLNQQNDLFTAPPRSGMRNDNYLPKTEKRTYSYYQEMKKKDPKKYWDAKTQFQMHKDGESLGASFFDDGEEITYNFN